MKERTIFCTFLSAYNIKLGILLRHVRVGADMGGRIWTCPGGMGCVICRENRIMIKKTKNYFLYIPFSI